jgi:Dolichyl-phosphate-mannose-protein mannosyltransferase
MYWWALRRHEMVNWVLLGIAAGLAVWAKYFVVVLALPLSLFLLFDRDARKRLATPGPYVALLVALLIVLPHLFWLIQHDYAPFQYVDVKWQPFRGQSDRIVYPARFLVEQLWYLLPMALIASPLFLPKGKAIADTTTGFDRRIVTLLAFVPAATLAIISAVTGRGPQTMWGYPLWLFLGLWCVTVSATVLDYPRLTRVVSLWMSVFVAFGIAYVANYWAIPIFKPGYNASFQGFMPGRELAAQVVERYRKLTGQTPPYVIGSMWIGGIVSHYTPGRPRVLLDGNPELAPWIDISDLRSKGAVVVGQALKVTMICSMIHGYCRAWFAISRRAPRCRSRSWCRTDAALLWSKWDGPCCANRRGKSRTPAASRRARRRGLRG